MYSFLISKHAGLAGPRREEHTAMKKESNEEKPGVILYQDKDGNIGGLEVNQRLPTGGEFSWRGLRRDRIGERRFSRQSTECVPGTTASPGQGSTSPSTATYRMGGDEFLLVLPNLPSGAAALPVAKVTLKFLSLGGTR
jgi:hypothetical protein